MKRLEKIYAEEGLKVVWAGFQDKKKNIRRFMEKHNVREGVGFDEGDAVSKKYGIRYGAGLVVINGEGVVKKRVPKGFSERKLYEEVETVIHAEDDGQKG